MYTVPFDAPEVRVLYAHCPRSAAGAIVVRYESSVSEAGRARIRQYVDPHDKALSLVGKYLLAKGLAQIGIRSDSLASLVYPPGKRPVLASVPAVRFSISHAGEWVVCALGTGCELGIDIEVAENRAICSLRHFFSPAEWETIEQGPDSLDLFYQYWVRKEAVIKAADQVAIDQFARIDTSRPVSMLDGQRWYLTPVRIRPTLACCLATDVVPRLLTIAHQFPYEQIQ